MSEESWNARRGNPCKGGQRLRTENLSMERRRNGSEFLPVCGPQTELLMIEEERRDLLERHQGGGSYSVS